MRGLFNPFSLYSLAEFSSFFFEDQWSLAYFMTLSFTFSRNHWIKECLQKSELIDCIDGKNLPVYGVFELENKKLVAELEKDGNCLLVTTYNLLVLSGEIDTSPKDNLFLGELIENLWKYHAKITAKQVPLDRRKRKRKRDDYEDDEPVDKMNKNDKDSGIDDARRKIGYLATNFAVDIDFTNCEIGTNAMDFYQLENYAETVLLEKRKEIPAFLKKLKIKLFHGWIPESIILPSGKRSLQMFFEARDSITTSPSEEKIDSWRSFIGGTQLTEKGISQIKRNMKKGAYAILLFNYSFHVMRRKNDEVYLLLCPNTSPKGVVQDASQAWVRLETMLSWVKVSQDKIDGYRLVYKYMETKRQTKAYIEAHKDICNERLQRKVVDQLCEQCFEGNAIITHNVNGLIRLLLEIPNCWENFYSKYPYVCMQEVKLPGIQDSSGKWEINMPMLEKQAEKDLIKKFLVTVEEHYEVYWELNRKKYTGVALFVRKTCRQPNVIVQAKNEVLEDGRSIIVEFESFTLILAYCHNVSGKEDQEEWRYEKLVSRRLLIYNLLDHVKESKKHVVITGDLNARICTPYVEIDKIHRCAQQELHELMMDRNESGHHLLYDVYYSFIAADVSYKDDKYLCSHPSIANFSKSFANGRVESKPTRSSRLDYFLANHDFTVNRATFCKVYGESNKQEDFYGSDHSPVELRFGYVNCWIILLT